MSNQYSCGCSYNYKRSMQRDCPVHPVPIPSSAEPAPCNAVKNPSCLIQPRSGGHHPDLSLAMGYVPLQSWSTPLTPCRALQIGTIFADLYKPFCGKRGGCR